MFEAYDVGAGFSLGDIAVPALSGLSLQLAGLVDGLGAAAAAVAAFEIPALAVATGASVGAVPSMQGLPGITVTLYEIGLPSPSARAPSAWVRV